MLFTVKYAPTFEQIPHDTKQIHDFVTTYAKQKKKCLLLHGPTGTGKTAAIHALAKKLNYELIEVNASDYRTAAEIDEKIGNALKQRSLFFSNKLILVDELDGIAGNEDRGGVSALVDLIKESTFPIICIANDAWGQKLNTLRTKSVLVEFAALSVTSMLPLLQRIISSENLIVDETTLKALARRSGGDLRGALLDLQTLAAIGSITSSSLETLHDRERSENIMHALIKIFKSTDPALALGAFDSVDEDIDECLLWIDENLPKEYKQPADISRAYDALSRADVFRGRIRKWQYWRYLVYVSALMTAGVAVAKDKKPEGFVQYSRTQRLLKIWMANQKYLKRKNIAGKLAPLVHSSARKTIQHTVPYVRHLYQNKYASLDALSMELKFDEEEIEWLAK